MTPTATDTGLKAHTIRSRGVRPALFGVGGATLMLILGHTGMFDAPFHAVVGQYFFFVGGAVMFLYNTALIVLRLPAIALDEGGLWYATLLQRRYWRWSEAGPFSADAHTNRWGETWYACAYDDATHALLAAHDRARDATYVDADIRIPLDQFTLGDSAGHAAAFADRLNRWRERYGRGTESSPATGSAAMARQVDNDLAFRRLFGYLPPLLLVAAVVLILIVTLD